MAQFKVGDRFITRDAGNAHGWNVMEIAGITEHGTDVVYTYKYRVNETYNKKGTAVAPLLVSGTCQEWWIREWCYLFSNNGTSMTISLPR